MFRILWTTLALLTAATVVAAPQTPGKLHVVQAKGGEKSLDAKEKDMVEARIPNPALPKMVSKIDVTTEGGAVLAGVVDSSPEGVAGGGRISIFVNLKTGVRSGTVSYSYQSGSGEMVKGKLNIQIGN